MTLQELVTKHGVAEVARACGVKEDYVKKCIKPGAKQRIRTVKLIDAAKNLK